MANSLMELYGGGMVGNRTNYQLGGRVASFSRDRQARGEIRDLMAKARRAEERKAKNQRLGNFLKFAGNVFLPGSGDLIKGVVDSQYRKEQYGDSKYAGALADELREGEDRFKEDIFGRALTGSVSSALMGDFYKDIRGDLAKAGQNIAQVPDFLRGIPEAIEAGREATEGGLGVLQSLREYAGDFAAFNPSDVARAAALPEMVSSATPTMTTTPTPRNIVSDNVDFLSDGFGISTSQMPVTPPPVFTPPPNSPSTLASVLGTGTSGFDDTFGYQFKGGGLINMVPKYQYGGFVKEAEKERFDAMNRPTSFGNQPNSAGENRGFMPPPPPPPPAPPTTTFTPPAPPAAPYVPGYGTATDVEGALTQLGMEDIYNDPRFAQYIDDLPDFQMGYAQKIGDIYAGGQQAARGIRAGQRQSAGQRGFTGSGIGQRQVQQAFGDLRTDIASQRRGVVEGFQADLLSAIGDIERKGDFEFASSARSGDPIQEIQDANPGMTREQAEAVYDAEFDRYTG